MARRESFVHPSGMGRNARGLVAALALGGGAAGCTTLIGLDDVRRVDCVLDCGAAEGGDDVGAETGDESSVGDGAAAADAGDAGDATDARAPSDARSDAHDASADAYVDPGIPCGSAYCKPGSQVCCWTAGACTAAFSCSTAYAIACDDRAECAAGEVCCAEWSGSLVLQARCATSCPTGFHEECNPKEPSACPNGAKCVAIDAGSALHECL